jgi:tripartite-type tricarboxylate transporter receptor subunit TctC
VSTKFLNRRTFLASSALLALPAAAQSNKPIAWPRHPVKLVVSGPAGSGGDIFARLLAGPLQEAIKQPVVVDNRGGANGLIGNNAVAKAEPDGHTFLFSASSSIALNPLLVSKMPYDTLKDLVPVAQIGLSGILLVANPSTGFKTLADMVRYAKANPGKLAYGTWGNGSSGHLAMETIKSHYKLFMPHIPYKGTSAVVSDLLGNNISVAFTDIASPVPHIRSGRLVGLGITGSSRGPALPDLPRLTEQGFKFDADGWYGVFAPAGTPPEIVNRMNEEVNKILATEGMRENFISKNMPPPPLKTADQFAATVASDVALWQTLAKPVKLIVD